MVDPILLLDTSSEEEACWVQARESDALMAQSFVRRAASIARGYVLASNEGRGDLAVADIMGSMVVDRGSAEALLSEALCVAAHPATAQAMQDGQVRFSAGRALLQVLEELPPELADRVEADVLSDLQRLAGRPPARVRELARKVALRLDPEAAVERRRQAAKRRHLGLRDDGDGMARLTLLVRAEHGLAILHRAERETRDDDGSGRTRDQRRADWVVDTLLDDSVAPGAAAEPAPDATAPDATAPDATAPDATAPDAAAPDAAAPSRPSQTTPGAELVLDGRRRRPVQVLVHVPVTTALGLDDEPASWPRSARSTPSTAGCCSAPPSCARSASTPPPARSCTSRTRSSVRSPTAAGSRTSAAPPTPTAPGPAGATRPSNAAGRPPPPRRRHDVAVTLRTQLRVTPPARATPGATTRRPPATAHTTTPEGP